MRGFNKLSAISIGRLSQPTPRANGKQRNRLINDGAGLYLQLSSTGSRTWLFRYRFGTKARAAGLGPLHTVSLAEARIKARKYRNLLLDGVDPIAAKQAQRTGELLAAAKTMTFRECAEAYSTAHRTGWKSAKHAAQWSATLTAYAHPVIGELPVAAVDVTLVMKVLEPIWQTRTNTASRVRGRIEAVLDWARSRGYRSGENPARWKGHLEYQLAARDKVRRVEHYAALAYAEMPTFMADLRAQESVAARALEFTILCAARSGEVLGAHGSELDLNARTWTIPATRMKSAREHRIPLSEAALTILEKSTTSSSMSRIFPVSERAMRDLLGKLCPGVTVHGFRSTFRSWAIEQTNTPTEVAEMALAHTVGSAVERAYQRSDLFDKRRQLAEAWAQFCAGDHEGNVIELRTTVAG
jgi:integrase